jgi:hypothetical protein
VTVRVTSNDRPSSGKIRDAVHYLGKALARLKSKGVANTSRYILHVICERIASSLMDLRFGGRICRTNLDQSLYANGRHTMVHSDYHVLKAIFDRVPISDRDVLVDVGCGEGRVINFWLSRGLRNPIIGLEFVPSVAERAKARYRKYPNVSIVEGEAIANIPANATIFFLYNPFSAETVMEFERAVRKLDPTIVYYNNNYMEPFQNGCWDARPIDSNGRIYEFRAAVITRRAS